jgi:ATP-dependent RNA helicase RhlE
VINYDLPMVAEDYIHRIGRTGRAGADGLALSLVSHDESGLLRDIRKLLAQDLAINEVPGFELSSPLRLDANAPRPKQGQRQPQARPQRQGGQRQPQARPQRQGGQRQGGSSHRPHGHAQCNGGGGGEHAMGNRKRRPRGNRPAAKA